MTTAKLSLTATGALLLILAAFTVGGAFSKDGDASGRISRFLPGEGNSLEDRVRMLEESLQKSNQIQMQLLELVDELRQGLEHYNEAPTAEDGTTAAQPVNQVDNNHGHLDRRAHYNRYRNGQLQRLIDAGLNPARAEFILNKQERFQYEQMQLAYQYRHLQDKSSDEGKALRERLSNYSHPRKMLEHQLSEQEFEAYLEATGVRQQMEVNRVVKNTPAATAGLRPGDKIISYNGERVFHMGDLRNQIYQVEPGETVAVEVQRAGTSNREIIYVPSGPLGIQG